MKLQTSEKIDIKSYIPIVIAIICIAGLIGTVLDIINNGYRYHIWYFIFVGLSMAFVIWHIYDDLYQNTKEG